MIVGFAAQTAKSSFRSDALRASAATLPREEGRAKVRPARADGSTARVAALLAAISQNNVYEGRDPAIIPDSLTSGFVADLLGLSISALADALVQLERLGLIAQAEGGTLKLLDRPGLDKLSDVQ